MIELPENVVQPIMVASDGDRRWNFPYGEHRYISDIDFEELKNNENLNLVPLFYFDRLGYWAIHKLGIWAESFWASMSYACPYSTNPYTRTGDRQFSAAVPVMLVTDDLNKYTVPTTGNAAMWKDCAQDVSWNRQHYLPEDENSKILFSEIVRSEMGSGYTDGTLPYDGHARIKLMKVDLDNGDYLLVYAWQWYNK